MTKLFLSLLFFCAAANLYSQSIAYDAISIPEKLRHSAHSVKRYEQVFFEVNNVERARYTVHQVFTVLDKDGAGKLVFHEFENKFQRLEDVEIRVFNAFGIQTAKYKKKDLLKRASWDGLIDDGTHYYYQVETPQYPVTVEYKYEYSYSSTMFYPSYDIMHTDESVERSSFTAKVPSNLGVRFKPQKTDVKPAITDDGKFVTYKWEVNNLSAIAEEEGAVYYLSYHPSIVLAPNKFSIYNSEGDMSSWKSLGLWSHHLYDGLDVLPDEKRAFFSSITKDAGSDREKVAILYKYLQKNFRYVSIQLRIGGWKPFSAKFTDEKKYGDCKGLSFYMYAALKSLGIKSHMAIINSAYNMEPVDPAFPVQAFNHVILCVPQPKDTIWLECTSNTSDFAVLGPDTENRNALLVTENGGLLVRTPDSKSTANIFAAVTHIELNDDGSGISRSKTSTKGEMKDIMYYISAAKRDEQKELLVNQLGFKQPDDFKVVRGDDEAPNLNVNVEMAIEKIPQFTAGNKMFLNPRLYSLWSRKMPAAENRKQDYYFLMPFIKTDTTCYHLPKDYSVEILPKPASFECAFGNYMASYQYDKEKHQLTSIARLELKQLKVPAQNYAEVKTFFDKVVSDGTQKLIIKKN